LVYAHQKTLHPKLEVIAEGEEENVFVNSLPKKRG